MTILADLSNLFPHTLTAQPVTTDAFGDVTEDGDPVTVSAYIAVNSRLVRDTNGEEVVSSATAITDGINGLTVSGHRYTLPAGFSPRKGIQALSVETVADESGALYEKVILP